MGIKFEVPIGEIVDEFEQELNKKINLALMDLYNAVVMLSPTGLYGGGRYRQAHHFSKNSRSDAQSGATDISFDIKSDRFVVLQNNLPYAGVIEHGGYPNPVQYGTWRKEKGMYEVRSVGGYSYQAPHGVYAMGVQAFMAALERY
ncbi:hypothetical protein LU276_04015 [Moraxella haemolytica]|uniref:hypothetical protein n=1 Tax=Moraxella haemolytica TaxID=2904119 RepID=UPI0025437CD0|nr:hypothetical protein [Moraxella sp. ZY171148]WII95988.1 hypothetical protein LU276_04015 [Moraxella sp. ZY171148]